jgi:EmrB/QacA subfamily drug resistance transporter
MTTTAPIAAPLVAAPAPGAPRSAVVLWTVLIAMFMAVLDVAIVNVALPTIHTDLHADGAGLQLSVSGYTISYAVLIVTGARLGDLWGHARVFRGGLVVFTLGSLLCGLAPDTGALIGFRVLQGVGAAAMVPQVLSIIQRTFHGTARIKAMSMFTAVVAGGAAVGQVLGGLLVSADLFHTTWRPTFLVNVPVGIVLFVLSGRVLRRDKGEPGRGLDPLGVAILTPTILALVLPLVLGHDEHWPLWGWLLLAASAVGVALFGWVESRVAARGGTPVIPGRVLRRRGFGASIGALFLAMSVLTGGFFATTLHLQSALGFSALDSGLAFLPGAVVVFTVSVTWRRLPGRWHANLVVAGFLIVALAAAGLALDLRGGGTGGGLRWALQALNGLGLGLAYSPLLGLTLSRVPLADAADASGIVSTVTQLAQLIGIATFGTLFLNLAARVTVPAGAAPGAAASAAVHASAHAIFIVSLTCAATALVGAALALRVPKPA